MVPGRPAQPRVEPVALPLSAGGVPVPGADRRQRPPGPLPARVRAAGHRRVRRRQVLDHRGALRQGRPGRPAHDDPGHQRRAGGRQHPRAAHRLVPQHLGLGCRRAQARPVRLGGGVGHHRAPDHRHHGADRRRRPRRRRAGPAVLRQRDQHDPAVRHPPGQPLPQGRHQRPRRPRRSDRQSRASRHQVRVLVPADRAGRTDRRAAAAAAPGRPRRGARRRIGHRLRRGDGPAAGRGGRVLRRAHPGRRQRGRGAGATAGVRRHAVEQAAVLLRRRPLAGRRPHPAGTAGVAQERPERQVAQLRRVRHHLHAGQVGVSLVRRLGPGLPHRPAGSPGPGVRQVPADPGLPGVVPAPQRGAAGVRVGFR